MAIYKDYQLRGFQGYGDYGSFWSKVTGAVQAVVAPVVSVAQVVVKPVQRATHYVVEKKIGSGVAGQVLGKVAQASLLPFALAVKPITYVAAKAGQVTGIKALGVADAKANQINRYAETHPLQVLGAQAIIAGAAIAAAPAAGASAATATTSTATTATVTTATAAGTAGTTAGGAGLVGTAVAAAESKAKDLVAARAKDVLNQLTGGTPKATQPPTSTPQTGAPINPIALLAPAGAGFVVAGPVGAVVGGLVGYFISKKGNTP